MTCKEENVTIVTSNWVTISAVVLSLQAACIPGIVVSSVLVIASITLITALQNVHNQILRSIGVMDLLIGVIVIPIYLVQGIPESRRLLVCHVNVWRFLLHTINCIEIISLAMLTLLSIDSFLQINFPLFYIKHGIVNKINNFILSIVAFHSFIAFVFFGLSINTPIKFKNGFIMTVYYPGYLKYYVLLVCCLSITVCIFSNVQVRYVLWKLHKSPDKTSTMLLMAYLILLIPTVPVIIESAKESRNISARIITQFADLFRFFVPLTNGLIIYYTRPLYKITIRHLLRTNIRRWSNVRYHVNLERIILSLRKSRQLRKASMAPVSPWIHEYPSLEDADEPELDVAETGSPVDPPEYFEKLLNYRWTKTLSIERLRKSIVQPWKNYKAKTRSPKAPKKSPRQHAPRHGSTSTYIG